MGSFQQIIMGIGCLIAAFWFGSVLQDRPAGQNQTAELLPEGTIDPYRTASSPNLVEKTKGFLDSFFESPSKAKPITVADLRADSTLVVPKLPHLVDHNSSFNHNQAGRFSPAQDLAEDLVYKAASPTAESSQELQPSKRFVGSFQSVDAPERTAKVAIVPDFSSLAEEVNRGLSFNDNTNISSNSASETRPLRSADTIELIPVPKFSHVAPRNPQPIEAPNWEAVREQVAAAERRLETHRTQMMQPIPEIEVAVNRRTQEFWDRQQAEARRRPAPQPSRLANHQPLDVSQQRRLKPETWEEKQERWDVFGNNRDRRSYPAEPPRRSKPKIVEVDRPFTDHAYVAASARPTKQSSAVVRSLNDDRNVPQAYVNPENDRFAYNARRREQPAEPQNQLRPQYNPSAGSQPEFVSPPDYGQLSPQANSAPSKPSEIVEAAEVTYGSFREYETRPQDTLQKISEEFYGTADYYFDLYLANRDLLNNPATVPPGITIKIPRFDSR